MRRIAALLLVFSVAGCSYPGNPAGSGDPTYFRYFHDDAHGVSCWLVSSVAISCLPDSELSK